jgi:hypothetical protein
MDMSLASARHRSVLLAGCILLAATVIFQACELWLEDHWIDSQRLSTVERAVKLIPSNARAWDNLGRLRQWDLVHPDPPGAIQDYRRALRSDPRSAHYWMDLASAEEASGDDVAANDAFTRARAVYPDSAEVAFYYGNFLLRRGQYQAAYTQLRRAVAGDPSFLPLAISRVWQASSDANQIIDRLLPRDANSYTKAIDYFASIQQCDAALAVWSRLASFQKIVPAAGTFPLLDELIREDRSADARRVWLQSVFGENRPPTGWPDSSAVWNGDFATNLSGGGLGWRWNPLPGVYLSFEAAPPQSGGRALRLDFNGGSNVDLSGPYQYVSIAPAQLYHFHALMRTNGITTESGLRFSIADPNHAGAVNVVTENFTGTHSWTPVDADVMTGSNTHFLVLRLIRSPSRLFDNKLAGTVWIADVSLVLVRSNSESHP